MRLTLSETDLCEACRYLGYAAESAMDEETRARVCRADAAVRRAAQPRYAARRLPISDPALDGLFAGVDIARHLKGCFACVLLGVTLGAEVDALLRRRSVADLTDAVLLDACASARIEQAAQEAEALLRAQARAEGLYLTGRFSPGYGDYPVEQQARLLFLIDGPRAIGLTATSASLLVPRKSVTAVCGLAAVPVTGHLAGCAHCALRETCRFRKEGKHCGTESVL